MAYTLKQKGSKLPSLAYKFSIVFGILAALLMMVFTFIAHLMNYKVGAYNMLIANGIFLLVMVIMVVQYKKLLHPKPILNTRQTYIFCVAMGVITAIVYSLLFYVYIQYIRPEFLIEYQTLQDGILMSNSQLSEIEILENRRIVNQATHGGIALMAFQEVALLSSLVSLAFAMFLRTER